jgi:hypothetical protein
MPICLGRASHALRAGRISRAAIAALLAFLILGAAPAGAWVFTSIVDFNLTETAATYGTYAISSSGDGSAAYEWVDDPNHTTIISGNRCSDLSLLGGPATIPAHDTTYHGLFGGQAAGNCFALRGRVATGAGSMVNHDGTLRR